MLKLIGRLIKILFGSTVEQRPEKQEEDNMKHHDYVAPRLTNYDRNLLKQFMSENGNFQEFHYRKGAAYTAMFGIAEGWGDDFKPGYVRIHPGVDRAHGGTVVVRGQTIKDVVMSPMNFESSDYIHYGNKSYGTLVILKNPRFQFEMRIAHMNPANDFIPWSLEQFKKGNPFRKDWYIGSAGTYGYSTGAHTHTELVSSDEASEVLELMLLDKYGEKINRQYTDDEVLAFYRSQANKYPKTSPYVRMKDWQILQDWTRLKAEKSVIFINEYKYSMIWYGKIYTRYATNKVLEGL